MQRAFDLIDQSNLIFCSLSVAIFVLVILISLGMYLDTLSGAGRGQ